MAQIKLPEAPPTKADNREELDFKFDEELPSFQAPTKTLAFAPMTRRRTTSLTLDVYEAP